MSDDVLERIRMCLAEAGHNPNHVRPARPGEWANYYYQLSVPREVAWRARETAGAIGPICHSCYVHMVRQRRVIEGLCLADRRLVEDCGVSRD